MIIELMMNHSESNAMNKNLISLIQLDGTLRNESSIINPVFTIEANTVEANYVFIPSFMRYYFITNIVAVRNKIWRIECRVDVLQSFKNQILNNKAIISKSETDANNYYNDGSYFNETRRVNNIIQFENGFVNNPSRPFYLIVAGGA